MTKEGLLAKLRFCSSTDYSSGRVGYRFLFNLAFPSLFDKYSSTFPSLEAFVYLNIKGTFNYEFLRCEKKD